MPLRRFGAFQSTAGALPRACCDARCAKSARELLAVHALPRGAAELVSRKRPREAPRRALRKLLGASEAQSSVLTHVGASCQLTTPPSSHHPTSEVIGAVVGLRMAM